MGNEKFTQGEWVVKDGHYPSMIDIHCGDCMSICVVLAATDLTFEQGIERKANAHLISASPDMYREIVNDIELLEREVEQYAIGSPRYNAIYDMIYRKRELISKANGEKQ